MKGVWRKMPFGLVPVDDFTHEQLKKLRGDVIGTFRQARNPKYHRYAMRMLRDLHNMVDMNISFDGFREDLLRKAGYIDTYTGFPDGRVVIRAKSLSYESMSDDEFKDCFLAIHQAFVDCYGGKLTFEELESWASM